MLPTVLNCDEPFLIVNPSSEAFMPFILAAVTATTRASSAAMFISSLPAACAALSLLLWLRFMPFSTRNGATP